MIKGRQHHIAARYICVTAAFLIFCAIFAVRLIYYQLAARASYAKAVSGASMRTVAVTASRGRICDRNGTVLVADTYTYNLVFDYNALPDTRDGEHKIILEALDIIEEAGCSEQMNKLYFPLEGSYPNYEYSAEALDGNTTAGARLLRYMKLNFVSEKGCATPEEALAKYSANELAEYIAKKYKLYIPESKAKNAPYHLVFSEAETDRLVRLRYAMELAGFGAVSNYTLIPDVGDELRMILTERHLHGVEFETISKRTYMYPGVATHILGYTGKLDKNDAEQYTKKGYSLNATVGKTGCEKAFEDSLHGTDGVMAIVEDDNGNTVDSYWVTEPKPGLDVWLTIDISLQQKAEKALEDNIKQIRDDVGNDGIADAGALVAVAPNSGEVLAMASYPSYSLETFRDNYAEISSSGALINYALTSFEPGSTFKVGMSLALLEDNIISKDTLLKTEGIYKNLKCSHYNTDGINTYCCGTLNVEHALEHSCNYFFCKYGDALGLTELRRFCRMYGFGEATGIEIGESTGRIADEADKAYAAAIGQSTNSYTPLQVSQYISMFANGGLRYSAHLLSRTVNTLDSSMKETAPTVCGRLEAASDNVATVRQGMYLVINGEASSYVRDSFADKAFVAAGKTGTAETNDAVDNAWFTAFAPYDSPEIVATCFIRRGDTGGRASAAVAETIDAYLTGMSKSKG